MPVRCFLGPVRLLGPVGKLAKPPHSKCGACAFESHPDYLLHAALAQLVERRFRNAEVNGSSPLGSSVRAGANPQRGLLCAAR